MVVYIVCDNRDRICAVFQTREHAENYIQSLRECSQLNGQYVEAWLVNEEEIEPDEEIGL